MKLFFFAPPDYQIASKPIEAMLKSYCRNFRIAWVEEISDADAVIFYGQSFAISKPSIFIPCIPHHRVPNKTKVNLKTSLPSPEQCNFYKDDRDLVFSGDLLQFLVGQLYRAEEYQGQHQDESLRGHSGNMLGERSKFFDRPIVDLWIKFLFEHLFADQLGSSPLYSIWGEKGPSVWLTHDVDILRHWTPKRSLWQLGTLPFKIWTTKGRKETREMILSWQQKGDPRDCLAKIVQLEGNVPSTFFFLTMPHDHLGPRFDMIKPRFSKSLQATAAAGKETGMHGSPLHLDKTNTLPYEAGRYEQVFGKAPLHSRQHFLMWDIRKTPYWQVELGLQTDSTLGFNNRPGFRCGTAMPFLWYDLERNQELPLLQIPLVIADHQLHTAYKQGPEAVLEELRRYYKHSSKSQGILTTLFHNMYYSGIEYPEFSYTYMTWLQELGSDFCQFQSAAEIRRAYLTSH